MFWVFLSPFNVFLQYFSCFNRVICYLFYIFFYFQNDDAESGREELVPGGRRGYGTSPPSQSSTTTSSGSSDSSSVTDEQFLRALQAPGRLEETLSHSPPTASVDSPTLG